VTRFRAEPSNAKSSPNGATRLPRRPKHVLVVGGAGYLGSLLTRRLLDRGYRVTVMDALLYGDEGIRDLYGRPSFSVVQGDIREIEAIVTAVRRADAVVHLGAVVGDPACELDEAAALDVNRASTRTLAAVSRGLGVRRFVFASTCGVYGAANGLLTEESPLAPVSVYSRSKMEAEALLLSMDGPRFVPVVLRFATFYGSSPRERFDLSVNLLTAKAVSDREIVIRGGLQWRPFIHVDDGCSAIIACLEAPDAAVAHQIFNVGSEDGNHTLANIAAIVAAGVPGTRVVFEPAPGHEPSYQVSFERIRTALGFRTRWTLADGVAEIRSAIETGAIEDYSQTRYSNHRTLMEWNGAKQTDEPTAEKVLAGDPA
jgi:nucleoside-diphosphate-sugar epimerase